MKILVAEDDVHLARAVRRVLEEERHVVEVAEDGRTALQTAMLTAFDAIVLDVMLPEMDGFDVCKRLRAAGVYTPVLMLTARADVKDRVRGLDAGADDYVLKPLASAELLARLRSLQRRSSLRPGESALELRAGGLTLDVSKLRAMRDGKEIQLTVREFQVLEFLVRNQGQVLTRTQIMDQVWEYDRDFASNVVDAYIHFLRSKVDKGFKRKLIHTVRGAGYTLRA